MHDVMEIPRLQGLVTYSARNPRALGAPVSPAPMVDGVVVIARRRRVDGLVRRIGRERDCIVVESGREGWVWCSLKWRLVIL